jgi:hypothetical protein
LRSNIHLLGIAALVVLAIVLDALLFFYRPPDSLEILIIADAVILVGLAADVAFGLRQRSVHSNLFRRLAESAPESDSPQQASPAEEPGIGGNATELVYHNSPDGLEFPAFVCTCGHPHQFLCLTCNMTTEKARQTAGTRWIEWNPDMKELNI